MKIAYLINTYPSPSHSFVRREIAALEASGVTVQRFALRSGGATGEEADRTRYVLSAGAAVLFFATLRALLSSPCSSAARSCSPAASAGDRMWAC